MAPSEQNDPKEEMGTLLHAAMPSHETLGTKTQVIPAEPQPFLSALKQDPDLRSLLNEYMHEVSAPRHGAEAERALARLERERKEPVEKQWREPTPGFVVKTYWNTDKIFINICTHAHLESLSSTADMHGHFPYSLGPKRYAQDKSGHQVATFDVGFHPRVLHLALSQRESRQRVISTSLEAVEALLQASRRPSTVFLTSTYHVLKGVVYKAGDPAPTCLRKQATPTVPESGTLATPPPYTLHVTPHCVAYIVNVAHVQAPSVHLTFPSPCSMQLSFSATSRSYQLNIATLPLARAPSSADIDVATENLLVLLHQQTPGGPVHKKHSVPIKMLRASDSSEELD
ncbi:hypothetical protein PsorP6_009551 [Peronosclerospora sorghi]|uniref:Uncharacterized protein n=1 Tax=Peronosclerospora sorghi TaxID=230839 RepID=A0ACC0W1W0_9STRA|nr:hypothetical protein PsorP6_009551 [Peronosclerospora sorghi]